MFSVCSALFSARLIVLLADILFSVGAFFPDEFSVELFLVGDLVTNELLFDAEVSFVDEFFDNGGFLDEDSAC